MTDYKQLCAELLSALESEFYAHCPAGPDGDPLIEQARAALVESKSIEDRIAEADAAIEASIERVRRIASMPAREIAAEFRARAVLARWGNRQELLDSSPADGEVAELVAWMRNQVTVHEVAQTQWAKRFVRAASLLERLSPPQPVPVPVSERLPEPEDCDAEGRCWWGLPVFLDLVPASWRFASTEDRLGSEVYWLPAHALPMPRHH